MDDITIESEELRSLLEFMTDVRVDELWDFVPKLDKVVASVSRLIVDTERYRNDADEPMATKGMGLYYTHTPHGTPFRTKSEIAYSKCLAIYDDYHLSLEEKVSNAVRQYGKCIILDCHSFHDEMDYTGFPTASFPDVCIGVNGGKTAETDIVIDAFKANGFSVKINEPFPGALVPIRFTNDERVVSIMIELNRRIYNNCHFAKIQKICQEIYDNLNI